MQHTQMLPLTEKDLSYIKDLAAWELVAFKKAYQYAHQTLEPECRQVMFEVGRQHQQNVENLTHHLQQHVNVAVQASVSGVQSVTTQM